jgi:diguanylate cyclase
MERDVLGMPAPPDAAGRGPLARAWHQRIEARIVGLFLALLLVVQLLSFALINHSIDANAASAIDAQLRVGERVFDTVLAQRARSLADETLLLASDFGLRSAIASDDRATIISALANHGQRIGAQVAFLTDAQFHLRAATRPDAESFSRLLVPAPDALDGRPARPLVLLDGRPFLLLQAPVRAPLLIGWVAMAFPVDQELLDQAQKVLSLEAVLVQRTGGDPWRVIASTRLMQPLERVLEDHLRREGMPVDVMRTVHAGAADYDVRFLLLAREGAGQSGVLLLRSVDEALAPYQSLQVTLLLLTCAGIALFAAGSLLTARRIANPIQALVRAASTLALGDYATPVPGGGKDEIGGLAGAFEDMRMAIRAREEKIVRLAYWDALTDLPNRAKFTEVVAAATESAGRVPRPCAVLMLDLDRFKQVNDVLGQEFGDRLLRRVAQRLSTECLDGGDVLARIGGDEFALLLPGADETATESKARRIQQLFDLVFTVDEQAVDLGVGIGFALFPTDGRTVNELLARAEVAMFAAKQHKSGAKRYRTALDTHSDASLTLLSELRRAIAQDELRLFLQPKVRLSDGRVTGAEALVRWARPERGIIPPGEFIPFAEQTGFIRAITTWMLDHGIAWLSEDHAVRDDLHLSVNLSTRDLLDPDLAARVEAMLRRSRVDPSRLCLEITESAIMDDPRRAQATLQQLHAIGVRLSIDDFGTGYSSLVSLQQLNVDELKIDRSFVADMEHDSGDANIVRSMIELAHNLGLRVVAEGIESTRAWDMLRSWHCDEAQGYLIGRPGPAADLARLPRQFQPPQHEPAASALQ